MSHLSVNEWFYDSTKDTVICAGDNFAVYMKQNGVIRVIENDGATVTNRYPMFLEEALIKELMQLKKIKTDEQKQAELDEFYQDNPRIKRFVEGMKGEK